MTIAANYPKTDIVFIRAELTDTFGGEANYSWCKSELFAMPRDASNLAIVRRVKHRFYLNGARCRRESVGDSVALYPIGACVVLFINIG